MGANPPASSFSYPAVNTLVKFHVIYLANLSFFKVFEPSHTNQLVALIATSIFVCMEQEDGKTAACEVSLWVTTRRPGLIDILKRLRRSALYAASLKYCPKRHEDRAGWL